MPRLLMLLLLMTPSQQNQQEGPKSMPDGLHAARVRRGLLELSTEEGAEVPGPVSVTSGWYFDPQGYENFLVTSAQRQARLAETEAQIAAYRAQALAAEHAVSEMELRLEKAVLRSDSCAQLAASACAAAAANTASYSAATLFLVSGVALLLGLGLGMIFVIMDRMRARAPVEK